MNYFIPVYYLLCLAIEYIISPLGNTFVKSFLMFNGGVPISFSNVFLMIFFNLLDCLSNFLFCDPRM